ncbi:MAG: TolC family outer membrane protein [Burkholderiaceae bacterium]|nr:TolC family outer membrane protein [Burkholderiaceae bacterium]
MPQRFRTSGFRSGSLAAAVIGLGCSTALGFDLSAAARQALQHDATFLAARKKAEADATRFGQGLGLLLPAATFTANRSQTDFTVGNNPAASIPAANLSYSGRLGTTYVATLTQPIFRMERLAAFNQERERTRAGEANFTQARIDALLRVTQAYFDVLVAQDSLASVDAELKAIGAQLESAKRNFEVGTATITDQQEAQARFDLATAKQIAARNDLDVKRNALNLLVGQPLPQRLSGLKDAVSLSNPEPLDVSKWVEQAREASLKVQAAASAAEIAKSEVTRVISADNMPTIDLVAQKRRVDPLTLSTNVYPRADTDTLSLELTLPLFNGGIAMNKAKEVVALRDKALFDLENERRNAEQTAKTAFLGVLAGLSQVKAYEAAERSSRLALESNLLGYEVGVRINIDVLNAQQQLYTTQRDLSKARYDTLINSLKLKASAGALSESDIDDINGLLAK